MTGFGTTVRIGIKIEENTGLIKHIFFDNRKLSISERVSIEGRNEDILEIEPLGSLENKGNGEFHQKFLVNKTIITRKLIFFSEFKDSWGSKFNLIVELPENRPYNLKWNILIKNPDFVFVDSKKLGKAAIPAILREGVFTINNLNASHLRIEEIDGVNIALPIALERKMDYCEYSFNKDTGLCFTYGTKAESAESKIKIEGYLSIARIDEPILDNSLILIDKNDWKSAIRSCAFSRNTKNHGNIFDSGPLFDLHNQFPMLFTDLDSKDTIEEHLRLGQAIKILKSNSTLKENIHYNFGPFENSIIENPSFRWCSGNRKFSFMLLLPDNPVLAVSVALLIRDLSILPIFLEDLQKETLNIYLERCTEKKVIVLCKQLEDRHKQLFKSLKIKIYESLLGNNEKASIKFVKVYTVLRILNRIKWYQVFIERNNIEAVKNSTLRSIIHYIQNEINKLPSEVIELMEIEQYSQLIIELLGSDYYSKVINSLKLIIGLDGIHFLSSLKIKENKSVSKLRRVSIVSQDIVPNQVISLIQYSLAFDTPTLIVDEEKHLKQEPKIVTEIIEQLNLDKPIEDLTEKLTKQLSNCPALQFLQSWSDFDYQLSYSCDIISNLDITPLLKKDKADKHLYSTKGAVSIFLKTDFPIEFGLGRESISSFTFGRFLVENLQVFRHQIISTVQQTRRATDPKLKFTIITIESDKKLLNYNEKIREVLRCNGDTIEAKGKLTKNELYEGFEYADLVFLFVHGDINKVYTNFPSDTPTLKLMNISEQKLFRGALILNSCKTGKDISGRFKGISSGLAKLGFPLIIAPIHEVSFRAASLFSMAIAKKLYHRISLSQIISFVKREKSDFSQYEMNSYLVFGSPYSRFYNPNLSKKETEECIEKID